MNLCRASEVARPAMPPPTITMSNSSIISFAEFCDLYLAIYRICPYSIYQWLKPRGQYSAVALAG